MANILILVAENSRAKLLEADFPRSELREVKDFTHEKSRLSNRELTNESRPGRTFDRNGAGRHAMEYDTNPKEVEAQVFARELVKYLDSQRNNGHAFKKLVLMAPPKFLGLLRSCMPESLRKLVAAEVNKSMVQKSAEQIQGELPYSF
jgi:protein required for attachment to host cells